MSDELNEHAQALLAEWADHPSFPHAVRLQQDKTNRVFNQFARQLARGERITAHDRGWHAGYLAALDYLIALPQKAKAEQFRNQQKKVS